MNSITESYIMLSAIPKEVVAIILSFDIQNARDRVSALTAYGKTISSCIAAEPVNFCVSSWYKPRNVVVKNIAVTEHNSCMFYASWGQEHMMSILKHATKLHLRTPLDPKIILTHFPSVTSTKINAGVPLSNIPATTKILTICHRMHGSIWPVRPHPNLRLEEIHTHQHVDFAELTVLDNEGLHTLNCEGLRAHSCASYNIIFRHLINLDVEGPASFSNPAPYSTLRAIHINDYMDSAEDQGLISAAKKGQLPNLVKLCLRNSTISEWPMLPNLEVLSLSKVIFGRRSTNTKYGKLRSLFVQQCHSEWHLDVGDMPLIETLIVTSCSKTTITMPPILDHIDTIHVAGVAEFIMNYPRYPTLRKFGRPAQK
jgi:hypothetical protein